MKKFLLLFTLLLTFTFCFTIKNKKIIYAQQVDKIVDEQIQDISCKSYYLMDSQTNTCVCEKDSEKHLTIASMTKIMILLLAFENIDNGVIDYDDEVLVSEYASGMGGSQVFLNANANYKVCDLLKSIIICSANDSSVAIAEKLYNTEQNAVHTMNERAKQLKMENTLFSNVTGLTRPTQYSCAKDVAIMLNELIKHEKYFEFSSIFLEDFTHNDGRKTMMTNTNKLIKNYKGCDGGKTGFTNESGFCLASTAKRGDTRLISVVIKAESSEKRFCDAKKLFDFGFNNFISKAVLDSKVQLDISAKIVGGKKQTVTVKSQENFFIFGKINEKNNIKVDFIANEKIKAPIKCGDVVGQLIIYKNNVQIGQVNAVSSENVFKKTYFDCVKDLICA